MNNETSSPIQKKKGSILKKIGIGIAIFFGFMILLGIIVGPSSDNPGTTKVAQEQSAFDVPALIGKNNLSELVETLGTPDKNSEPTQRNIDAGIDTWEKSWEKGNYFLMATYKIETKEVIDLFVGANTDAGFEEFKDTKNILKAGNLSQSANNYSVEFVKAKNGPGYTGAIVKQK